MQKRCGCHARAVLVPQDAKWERRGRHGGDTGASWARCGRTTDVVRASRARCGRTTNVEQMRCGCDAGRHGSFTVVVRAHQRCCAGVSVMPYGCRVMRRACGMGVVRGPHGCGKGEVRKRC